MKTIYLTLLLTTLVACAPEKGDKGDPGSPGIQGPAGSPGESMVYICYLPGGKKSKRYNMYVPASSVSTFEADGSYLGSCD